MLDGILLFDVCDVLIVVKKEVNVLVYVEIIVFVEVKILVKSFKGCVLVGIYVLFKEEVEVENVIEGV